MERKTTPLYVAAYDTEAVYCWWDDRPTDFRYDRASLRTFLAGVRAVAEVHMRWEAPATFFLVAKMLDLVGPELRSLLDHPLFDIQCHSYTHPNLLHLENDGDALQHELADSRKRIEDAFGRPVIGLTAPGGYTTGFARHPRMLEALWRAGYRYTRSVGAGPKGTMPAPFNPPFWYAEDGFPDLLETPSHAWHDNILTGQPGAVHWPPPPPWSYPSAPPTDAQGVYEAYAPGMDHCVKRNLLYYLPIFHPWSIYRIDARAGQLDRLLVHARTVMSLAACQDLYQIIHADRALASETMILA